MSRPSDHQQREQALDLARSCIVQAPAGSGKTELLIQRTLALLSRVENPEEIVAITFTRKAAAEMRNRLVTCLHQAERTEPTQVNDWPHHEQVSYCLARAVLENDAARGWNLLQQPSRLRVRTIDSLCSELARQLPVLSGLGGGQQITENPSAAYRLAATRTMSLIEHEGDSLQADITRVLGRYNNQYDHLVDLLANMLANREQWLGHLLISRAGEGLDRQALESSLRFLVESQLRSARALLPERLLRELPRLLEFALENQPADQDGLRELLHTCVTGDFLDLPNRSEALGCWQTLICRLLTANGKSWRKAPDRAAGFPAPSGARGEERVRLQGFKDDFTALLDENRDNDELREALDIVRTLPAPGYDNEAWESLESLMRILLRAAAEWKLVMAERGQVDYSEMAARAIESLGDEEAPTDLALRMDYRIQHLLVDEFQDTSASQIRLLEKLTAGWVEGDGHTVFLVGDPMQSIYRFRKAEVSLFIKAWQGQLLDHLHLLPLLLTVNFRSTAPVVDWVNRVFPLAMPPRDDPVTGAVSYRQAHTHPDVGSQGQVSLKVLPQRDDTEEARQAVEYIKRCNADESIAILVRVRHHANTILAELDKLKDDQPRFRYQAIKFNRLADTPLVRDLVSLTLALMQPADRLAWFSVLRAPYIGLDLADLDALVAGDSERIILDALNSGSGLSNEGRQRLQRASPILLQAVERRGRQSVRSLIEWVWISLGGPACTANASEMEDASTYFDLLDSMEDENLPIDRDSLELGMENLYAQPDPDASNKLQVLTIYEAKGLQFDTVILPGLNRRPGGDKTSLLHWFELAGEDRIVMSPMRNTKEKEQQKTSGDLIKYISTIEKQRQSLEDARLLYVAATRARKKLHLLAAIRPDARDNIKPDAASMMARLWPAVREQQETLILQAASERVDNSDAEPTATALPQVFTRFSSNWRPPELPEAIDLPVLATVEARDYIEFNWVGEDARLAGILVHRQLQLIAEHGLTGYLSSSGMEAAGNWRQHYLRRHGVQGEKARLIVDAARQAVANCLASDKGRWILSPHPQARCEYRLTAIIAGQARNLVLDRTFVDDGIRWVIDYKTSSHGGGNLEGFLANEAERYREQLHRYRVALALTESLPIKTALYFPLLDRLVEVN